MGLLAQATNDVVSEPPIITIYGGPGSRKTQFGIDMPNPIMALYEHGLGDRKVTHLKMVGIKNEAGVVNPYIALLDLIKELGTTDHGYRSFVIDSLDHLCPHIDSYICARDQKTSIEAYGYGKGFDAQAAEWLILMNRLIKLRTVKQMNIVLIAHAAVRSVSDPTVMDNYDRWEPKLPKKACAIVKELSDIMAFSSPKMTVTDSNGKTKAVGKGDFSLYLNPRPSYEAKNRYHLPDTIEVSAKAFMEAFNNRLTTSDQA